MGYVLYKDNNPITKIYESLDDIPVQTHINGGKTHLDWPQGAINIKVGVKDAWGFHVEQTEGIYNDNR